MSKTQRAIKIAFLIPDQSWCGTVISPAEIFYGMALNPNTFQNSEYRGFETTFLRTTRRKVKGFSGFPLETTYFADTSIGNETYDAVIIPSVWDLSMDNLTQSHAALEWLREQHNAGAIVAGLVTGVFYLAEAGLLDEREATIHWASVNIFKQRYPKIKVTPQLQMIEADNIITTSSTPATFDVSIMLIQRFLGDRSAEYAAHYFRIRDKDAPLPEFLEPSSNDSLVDAARDTIRLNYTDEITLENLAKEFNVTPRTLSRRFLSATGTSPIQYLIKQRLNVARNLLQSTDLQIQQIAEQSGFGSATVFCRNFKKEYSQTPREFRDTLPS
ncbi:MAG: helix-turn-helix domain-containing protein [Pseudomonadales bacterium]|nr:helix-turn-helix domain-containing protein [Pseudomonadales bacterium]